MTSGMTRLVLLVLVAVASVWTVPAWAAQSQRGPCAPYSRPISLKFVTLNPPPVYNNRLNVDGIRNLFSRQTGTVAGPHRRALGITYALTSFSLQGSTIIREVTGGYCIYIDSVTADFGWKRLEVYVAAEFKPGTCEYRAVLDHENQHVAVNNRALKEFAPQFRAALEDALSREQPMFVRAIPANADASFMPLNRKMSGQLAAFQTLTAERNAPLDSASNYGETAKLCKNWNGDGPPPQTPAQTSPQTRR